MKIIKPRNLIALVLVFTIMIWANSAFAASIGLAPDSKVAVFDSYGNNYHHFEIDPEVTIFSNSNNGGLVLSSRPTPEVIDAGYNASPLKGVHPRILASKEDFNAILSDIQKDEKSREFYTSVIANADALLSKEPLIWELRDDVRLWYVSMDFIDRMLTLGMAYRLTGDVSYAGRGWREMNAIAQFDTWHPEHHIDVGGLAVGYAIGYDWLYDYYTPTQREKLERAANRLCFEEYVDGLQKRSSDMKGGILAENNHNAVMNSGGIMMAAAFYDKNPELCSYIISSLIRATEYTVDNLIDDGSWYEGISYGTMMIEYYSMELATLDKIFGLLYGLEDVAGTDKAVDFVMNFQCATSSFSYGDGGQGKFFDPGMYFFMDYFGKGSENFESSIYATPTDLAKVALSLLWYKGESDTKAPRATEAFYPRNDVVTARNSWNTLKPTFVGMKGAIPKVAHGHMDIGTFCFYSDGVQWTYDPGSENYNVPDYWETSDKNSGRWQYYRMRAEAHNCIVVNPSTDGGYEPASRSQFTRYETNDSSLLAVLDMKNAHGSAKVDSALRGYYFADNRQSFVIRDEITPVSSGKTAWFMSTKQTPEIIDGKVYLSDSTGKKLKIEFASDSPYELSITDAAPLEGYSPTPEGNSENKNVKRIVVMLDTSAYTPFSLTAKLTPESAVDPRPISDFDIPLENWKLSEHIPSLKISTSANLGLLPAGTSLEVDVSVFGASPTDTVKVFEKAPDGAVTQLAPMPYSRYTATVSADDRSLVAVLYDSGGNEISRSPEFSLKTFAPSTETTVWDVDFEDETLTYSGSGVTVCDSTGKPLTNSQGQTLRANRNPEICTIELSNCDVGNNGKSLYLRSGKSSVANDQAQLNNFNAKLSGGVAVFEMDYLFKDFNTAKTVMGVNSKNTYGNAFWSFMLNLGKDGTLVFGDGKDKCELNRWYKVKVIYDIDSKLAMCIIDGKYVGKVFHEDTVSETTRFSFQLTCTDNTEAYADNFKVTHLKY